MKQEFQKRSFPAKLLLFGEYTVLLESQALAMPLPQFSGQWQYREHTDKRLLPIVDFLASDDLLSEKINVPAFKSAIQEGLCFDANIPQGYGLGSSGALCAAIYAAYGKEKITSTKELKSLLASLEAFFHGKSSGLDPLIAFLDQPLVKLKEEWIVADKFKLPVRDELHFFLLDTQQSRKADQLIRWFVEQCKQTDYRDVIESKVIPEVDGLIAALMNEKTSLLLPLWHELSWLQWKYFQPMIPDHVHTVYLDGLESDWYKLKICGAGGGGFFLGITNDIERLQKEITFDVLSIQ